MSVEVLESHTKMLHMLCSVRKVELVVFPGT